MIHAPQKMHKLRINDDEHHKIEACKNNCEYHSARPSEEVAQHLPIMREQGIDDDGQPREKKP